MVSHCGKRGWETPVDASFAGDGVEADPIITSDGKHLYFISTRSTDGQHHNDLDIWRADRQPDGKWGEPRRLPEPLNSRAQEWFPRPAAMAGFISDRAGRAAPAKPTSGARGKKRTARGGSRTPAPRSIPQAMSTSPCPRPTAHA